MAAVVPMFNSCTVAAYVPQLLIVRSSQLYAHQQQLRNVYSSIGRKYSNERWSTLSSFRLSGLVVPLLS